MPGRPANSDASARYTLQALYARHHQRSYPIYMAVVLAFLSVGFALPFVYVDVGSQARAIIQTTNPATPITIGGGGKVTLTNLKDNQVVAKGDTLLILDAHQANSENRHITEEIIRHQESVRDLELLVSAIDGEAFPSLYSAVYQRDYQAYRQELDEASLKETFASRQLQRQESLFAKQVIAEVEIEQFRFDHEMARNAVRLLRERQHHVWTQELMRYERELRKLRLDRLALQKRSEALVVTAPASGNLLNVDATLPGNYLDVGTRIAEISPDSELELAVSVSPQDIGLLRPGMSVNLEIDAFNRSRWGFARAEVREIARDITMTANGHPAFIVKCTLIDSQLTLPSGHQGMLKKGMTATAHFVLARRTLFQLLQDRVEDWLPSSLNTKQ